MRRQALSLKPENRTETSAQSIRALLSPWVVPGCQKKKKKKMKPFQVISVPGLARFSKHGAAEPQSARSLCSGSGSVVLVLHTITVH